MKLLEILYINYAEIVKNILTSVAILVGGSWTFWRFVLQREGQAKIEFNVDINVVGIHKNEFIVELTSTVQNKGLVRHYIKEFYFDLLYLSDKEEIEEGDKRINFQLLFKKIIDKRLWVPKDWYVPFIDAGVTQKFKYLTHLPVDTKFALLYTTFKHPDTKKDFHTAQKTIKVDLNSKTIIDNGNIHGA